MQKSTLHFWEKNVFYFFMKLICIEMRNSSGQIMATGFELFSRLKLHSFRVLPSSTDYLEYGRPHCFVGYSLDVMSTRYPRKSRGIKICLSSFLLHLFHVDWLIIQTCIIFAAYFYCMSILIIINL